VRDRKTRPGWYETSQKDKGLAPSTTADQFIEGWSLYQIERKCRIFLILKRGCERSTHLYPLQIDSVETGADEIMQHLQDVFV
jgi:hypothetical protein